MLKSKFENHYLYDEFYNIKIHFYLANLEQNINAGTFPVENQIINQYNVMEEHKRIVNIFKNKNKLVITSSLRKKEYNKSLLRKNKYFLRN